MSFFGKSNQALLVILNIILATACTGGSSKESCDSCEVPVDDTLFISSVTILKYFRTAWSKHWMKETDY